MISLKDTIALGGSLVQPRPVNKNERGQKQPLIILYTLPFKSWGEISPLCSESLDLFAPKYSKKSVKYYYNLKQRISVLTFEKAIYLFDFQAAITLVFSVTWSFRSHSNMLIWCSRNIIINVETRFTAWYLCENLDIFFQDSLMNRMFKTRIVIIWHFFFFCIFCNVGKIFTFPFDH